MSMIPPKPLTEERLSGIAGLDQRSRDIFRRLVDTYLATGEPVGSRTISRILPQNLSPASVRNVMMDLEDAGLIFSPHTSAGRMPTEQGLRFFVDAVMEVGAMPTDERAKIDAQIAASNRQRRVEDLLGEATTLLSGLSHCAGVILAPKMNARLKHIEFVNLGPGRALVILVGEDGSVENRVIEVPRGLPPSTLAQASNYLSARFQGKTIDEVQRFVRDEMAQLRTELDEISARVVEAGIGQWSGEGDSEDKTLIVRGQANLIENATAAEDLERIRKLFEDIENKKELVQLLGAAEMGEGVRIFIGSENRLFSLSGSSIIVTPFRNSEEKIVGVMGIIGPTRMNYARIIPMVDYTAKAIGRLLT
ncbi:MAG: heat-inducible transcriptional repressor HrcA [Aestuariivirga sp.]|uniref:heat-inducible transcriptional repressor HrcA n=1 Tax=Aestuariivirga sp. TaxID=2650926 RepID=UPI0025BE8F6D|nr:heat-inducible transcriptional repressor HrcA [Aestuariivirga sp.]MCA3560207.1 heat-inducible transcriptional repressor HrcA [Aestuariivirga sp.]